MEPTQAYSDSKYHPVSGSKSRRQVWMKIHVNTYTYHQTGWQLKEPPPIQITVTSVRIIKLAGPPSV